MYEIFSNICLILMILLVIYTVYKIISKKENNTHKITSFIDKHYKIFLILIFIVFVFTRVYDLDGMPNTLNIDEASLAYNAFSIAEYGTDRYANIFPVYFLKIVRVFSVCAGPPFQGAFPVRDRPATGAWTCSGDRPGPGSAPRWGWCGPGCPPPPGSGW